jgi:hypothetical protein
MTRANPRRLRLELVGGWWRASAVALPLLITSPAVPQQPAGATPATAPLPRVGTPQPPPVDELPDKREARARLYAAYALAGSENLKLFLSPFPPERAAWLRVMDRMESELVAYAAWSWNPTDIGQDAMGTAAGPGQLGRPVRDLVLATLRLHASDIDGPGATLLDQKLWADVVLRAGTPREQLVGPLGSALRRQARIPVRLSVRDVRRDLWVARAKPNGGPPSGGQEAAPILIYGKDPPPPVNQARSTVSGSGGWGTLLDRLGLYVGRQVITDGPDSLPPRATIYYSVRRDRTTDSGDEDAVIEKVSEQTGLTFAREKRPVRVLWVEKAE